LKETLTLDRRGDRGESAAAHEFSSTESWGGKASKEGRRGEDWAAGALTGSANE
jgi:hypothetical protein